MSSYILYFTNNSWRNVMRILLASLSVLNIQACSRTAEGVTTDTPRMKQSVIIVREIKPEFPQAYIKAMRELQEGCIAARTSVSNLQGKSYDSAKDRWTDDDILKLYAGRIEEYFDINRYAVYKIISQPDLTKMDSVDSKLSCRAPVSINKTVDIESAIGTNSCTLLSINYTTNERIKSTSPLPCKENNTQDIEKAQQVGDAVDIEGTIYKCKWSSAAVTTSNGSVPTSRQCTLVPNPIHAGTGRALIAIAMSPDPIRLSTQALGGTEKLSLQSVTTIEKAIDIKINTKIEDSKFQMPSDSLGFSLTEYN
jgi:hypothetical protein